VHEPVDLAVDDSSTRACADGAGAAQVLQAAPDRRKRIAQLMREGGEELGLEAVGLGQVGGHATQGVFGAAALGDVVEGRRPGSCR
jgi:hypothetical protein